MKINFKIGGALIKHSPAHVRLIAVKISIGQNRAAIKSVVADVFNGAVDSHAG